MVEELACISCGSYITLCGGSVKFNCPECGEAVARCERCRILGKRYVCQCGFSGP